MPYRTHENRIDGLVITFSDATQNKRLERELRSVQAKRVALPAASGEQDDVHGLS